MIRILCLGDNHIPYRAKNTPKQIVNHLATLTKTEFFDYTLFTGDLIMCPELIVLLKSKTKKKRFFSVLGNMDYHYGNRDSPIYHQLNLVFNTNDKIFIGLTHGSQIRPRGDHVQLEKFAIEKKINVIVSGHTHKEEVFLTKNGTLLLNPGSATGAWSFVASGIPSFILLNINESNKEIHINLFQVQKNSRELMTLNFDFTFRNSKIL